MVPKSIANISNRLSISVSISVTMSKCQFKKVLLLINFSFIKFISVKEILEITFLINPETFIFHQGKGNYC